MLICQSSFIVPAISAHVDRVWDVNHVSFFLSNFIPTKELVEDFSPSRMRFWGPDEVVTGSRERPCVFEWDERRRAL